MSKVSITANFKAPELSKLENCFFCNLIPESTVVELSATTDNFTSPKLVLDLDCFLQIAQLAVQAINGAKNGRNN